MPPLVIREDVPLAPFTTLGIGGLAHAFAAITDEGQVPEALAYAEAHGLAAFVLGGGSNLIVRDEGYGGLVLHMQVAGIEQDGVGAFEVGAGVTWEDFVRAAIEANCAGVECLAGIPGSTGGTPVQNVGAYGQEVSETITAVRAFDREARAFVDLPVAGCNFRYRASLFNSDARGRYVVTRVRFQLRPGGAPTLKYADLRRYFEERGVSGPSLAEVAAAVREVRRAKSMLIDAADPNTRSAGSYFKNPVVGVAVFAAVAKAAGMATEEVPHWPAEVSPSGDALVKLPAAWLLEHAGFVKGYGDGCVGISTRHTLALVNRGGASFADLLRFEAEIVAGVEARFGVRLEREPVLLA